MPPPARVPPGTTELGIDIIKVDRIRDALARFGARFSSRVLTDGRAALRARPAGDVGRPVGGQGGRLARSSASASAGIGWRDIEIERLPTGQPAVRLHGRAAARAEQLGMGRIAVSITHESDYAVAIAFGVRTAGGRFLFPPDIEERLDDRERRILARIERLRDLAEAGGAAALASDAPPPSDAEATACLSADRSGSDARGRRRPRRPSRATAAPFPAGAIQARRRRSPAALLPERPVRGHKGSFGKLLVIAGSLDYAGAALLVCRAAGRAGAGLVTLAVPESLQPLFAAKVVEATTMALPEDDVEEVDPEPALARILDHEHDAIVVGPGLRPGLATAELVRDLLTASGDADPAPIVLDAEALRSIATMDALVGGRRAGRRVLTPHAGEFARLRAGSGARPGRRRRPRRRRRRPGGGGPRRGRDVGPGRGAEGRRHGHRGAGRVGRRRAVREPGARDRRDRRRAGRARSGRCSPRASTRSPRPGSASTSTAWPATAVRERFGDAGLLASDLPDGAGPRPQAAGGDGRAAPARGRLGFGRADEPSRRRRPASARRSPRPG